MIRQVAGVTLVALAIVVPCIGVAVEEGIAHLLKILAVAGILTGSALAGMRLLLHPPAPERPTRRRGDDDAG